MQTVFKPSETLAYQILSLLFSFTVAYFLIQISLSNYYMDIDSATLLESGTRFAQIGEIPYSPQAYFLDTTTNKILAHLPFHYALTGIIFKLFGISVSVASIISAIEASIGLLIVYSILKLVSSYRAALMGVLLVGASFNLLTYTGTNIRPDMECAVLSLATLMLLLSYEKKENGLTLFFAGLTASIAFLSHGNAFVVIIWLGLAFFYLSYIKRTPVKFARKFATVCLGGVIPIAIFLLWMNDDLLIFFQAISSTHLEGSQNISAKGGENLLAQFVKPLSDSNFFDYILNSLQTEYDFRLKNIIGMDGMVLLSLQLFCGVIFLLKLVFFSDRQQTPRVLIGSYLIAIAIFLLFMRTNKSVAYAWMFYLPLALVCALTIDDALNYLSNYLSKYHKKIIDYSSVLILFFMTIFLIINVKAKATAHINLQDSWIPYQAYTDYLKGITGNSKVLGDSRLSYGYLDEDFTHLELKYCRFKNNNKPIENLETFDWVLLNEEMCTRFSYGVGKSLINKDFYLYGNFHSLPYGNLYIYRNNRHRDDIEDPVLILHEQEFIYRKGESYLVSEVNPNSFSTIGDGTSTIQAKNHLEVHTSNVPYGYELMSESITLEPHTLYDLGTNIAVMSGGAAIGILDSKKQNWLGNFSLKGDTQSFQSVSVPFKTGTSEKVYLVLQNNNPKGAQSIFRIENIRIDAVKKSTH